MPKPIEHHTVILDDAGEYQRKSYGVMSKSRHVYETTKISYGATRLVVWDNTGRPNPFKGAKLGDVRGRGEGKRTVTQWFIDSGKTHPLYFDPHNEPTDDPVSILLSPEGTALCADTSMNTGQPGSGQVFADGKLGDGDTATLVYPDGTTREITLHFPRYTNGHGYATFQQLGD